MPIGGRMDIAAFWVLIKKSLKSFSLSFSLDKVGNKTDVKEAEKIRKILLIVELATLIKPTVVES
jgi:hypothetical protein